MAQEPVQTAKGGGGTAAAAPASAGPSRGAGSPVVFKDRYSLFPGSPLPALNSPTAAAFVAEDRRDPAARLFVLVCDPTLPCRSNVMRSLKGVKVAGLLPLVEWGTVHWPLAGRKCMVVVYEEPLGGRVNPDPRVRLDPVREHEIVRRVIEPLTNALKELNERSITHRAIRPSNLFYMDPGKQQIVFGECVTTPPGYDQPVLCEPIPQGFAQREGRGVGTVETDLYALGVSVLVLLTGRNPMPDLDDSEIMHLKVSMGSYAALVTDQRLPLPMIEVLRGLLSDDPMQRWDRESLELWLAGRRLSPIQAKPAPKAQRDFPIKSGNFSNARELAHGIGLAWNSVVGVIQDGQLELWLRRSLEDKPRAEAVGGVIKLAEVSGGADGRSANDFLLVRVCALLDPDSPIRYRGLSLMPDGFGTALAVAVMQRRDPRTIIDAITFEIPKIWFDGHDDYNPDHLFYATEFREMRSLLVMTAMGYGVERILYEMNETIPCQSPMLSEDYVVEIYDLLPALDEASKKVDHKISPVDRHVAAFIATRYEYDLDPQFAALNDPAPERSCSGMLSLLAVLQYRGGPEAVLGLASWAAGHMDPLISFYHSRERRKIIDQESPALIRKGRLPELFALLDNAEERQKDREGFAAAKAEHMAAETEIMFLESGGRNRDEASARVGHQAAAVTSVVIALLTLTILLIARLW
ncbi:MAG: hypothetical protein H7840_06720 [Alphaproteobacteria bacterium]